MSVKYSILLIFSLLLLVSCGSSKRTATAKQQQEYAQFSSEATPKDRTAASLTERISENAKKYMGTRYKYGGTSKKGMDCSGLIYMAFLEEDVSLPRTSRGMSLLGDRLFLKEVKKGDLLFFETNKNRKVINHVGLVVKTNNEEIFFIHSTSSLGVIISALSENYWREHFVMARRIL